MAAAESYLNLLVSHTQGAIRRYHAITSQNSDVGDLASMGKMLSRFQPGLRRHGWSLNLDLEANATRAFIWNGRGLVLSAESNSTITKREPDDLLNEWNTEAGVLPSAAVIYQRRGGKDGIGPELASVRFEIQHPDSASGLTTVTQVSQGSDTRIIPVEVEGVSVEPVTPLDVAKMYRCIFSMAGNH